MVGDFRNRGWRVQVIATPTAVDFLDIGAVEELTGRPTPLGDAIAHDGRVAKTTLHILRLADEPGYRRPTTSNAGRAGQRVRASGETRV